MFSTSRLVITWPTSEVVAWISGISLVTVMVSDTVATFMVKSTVDSLATRTSMSLITWVAKPVSSTLTSYRPAGRDDRR